MLIRLIYDVHDDSCTGRDPRTHAKELLRAYLARHPGQSRAEILEQALAERVRTRGRAKAFSAAA